MVKKRPRSKFIGYKRKEKKKQQKVTEASITAQSAVQTEDAPSSSPAASAKNTRAISTSRRRRQSNQPSDQRQQLQDFTVEGEDEGLMEVVEKEGLISDGGDRTSMNNITSIKAAVNMMESKRHAIAFLFIQKHGIPPRDTWKGRNGIASKIKESLGIKSGTDIIVDMEEIMSCLEQGVKYDPSMKSGRGRKPKQAVIESL